MQLMFGRIWSYAIKKWGHMSTKIITETEAPLWQACNLTKFNNVLANYFKILWMANLRY
jgi:hypothetical protein